MHLVLASASPRRAELLRNAGFSFTVRPASVEETRLNGEDAETYVKRLAIEKADAVDIGPGEVVLGADTTVVVDNTVLEKPLDADDARRMLALLAGREHEVITGIGLRHAGGRVVDTARTRVRFAALSTEEIEGYVASGEPFDKAGGYAIQGLASRFVEGISGCYFNVVGLPVPLVWRHLRAIAS